MWTKTKSLLLSRILTVVVAAVFVLVAFVLPLIVEFYDMISEPIGLIKGEIFIPFCIGLYIAIALALVALFFMHKLLDNISSEIVFDNANTKCLRIISWCCILAASDFFILCLWRYIFVMPAVIVMMLGLIMRVLKNVFDKAVEIKSENDLSMPIIVNLDVMMAKRKMSSQELAEKVGITTANLSILKTGKAKAVRFSTLEKICEILDCQPGDILEFQKIEIIEEQ